MENTLQKQAACATGTLKISFCVICMNRLAHLQETLLRNLLDNSSYPELELVLLDYNSQDEMESWAKQQLGTHMDSGRLVYYKTFEPQVFSHSHAKNLAFKLATGDIVCNVNADVFLGADFAVYLHQVFSSNPQAYVYPEPGKRFAPGASGIVCVNRKDFLQVGGFDERMKVYGWEDRDFLNRLAFAGKEECHVVDTRFLKVIDHIDKYDKPKLRARIHDIYIDRQNPIQSLYSRVLILFKDHTFKFATIVNNAVKYADNPEPARVLASKMRLFQYELVENDWQTGIWQQEGAALALLFNGEEQWRKMEGEAYASFYKISQEELLDSITYFEMDYHNRRVMLINEDERRVVVNDGTFGKGVVFKNFDYTTPLYVA